MSLLQSDFILARDDYKELTNLCIKILGGKISFGYRTPAALDKARWMAKLSYNFKIFLLQSAMHNLITAVVQLAKLKWYINFSALIYFRWWFLSSSAPYAPHNDFMLLRSVMDYVEIDKLMSNSAEKALLPHLYIVPEINPLSLFSSVVSTNERERIAEKTFTVLNLWFVLF